MVLSFNVLFNFSLLAYPMTSFSILVIMQIENEYGFYERFYGEGGAKYAMWAAKMAVSQNIGVPWIMCQQYDAPDPVVRSFIS